MSQAIARTTDQEGGSGRTANLFPDSPYASSALMRGFLVKESRMLVKSWKKRYFVLDLSPIDGLRLLYFKANRGKLPKEPEGVFKLDSGCIVRDLDPADVGGKEFCFHLLTAGGQLRLQASSEKERRSWATALDAQIKCEIELAMYQQKMGMLCQGGLFVLHTQQGKRKSCTLTVTEAGATLELLFEDAVPPVVLVPVSLIDRITPGRQSRVFKLLSDDGVQERNCLSLMFKQPSEKHGDSLDFEMPNQNVRDNWASALQTLLHKPDFSRTVSPNWNPLDGGNPYLGRSSVTGHLSAGSESSSSGGERPVVKGGTRRSMPFGKMLMKKSTWGPSEGNGVESEFSAVGSAVGSDFSAVSRPEKKKGLFKTPELTELFKTKIKLDEDIPYGLCVSKALSAAVNGDASEPELKPGEDFTNSDFSLKKHYSLSVPIGSQGGKSKSTSMELYDYAGKVFRSLRRKYGVDDREFLESLADLTGDGLMGNGKSGMLFFFTKNRKYVLKTVKQSETDLFVSKGMIKGYYQHMERYPDSLICRFMGFYRIKIAHASSNKWMGLVVMANSYDTPLVMHEKYDLKGSTRKRWCEPKFGSVLKDLNFTGKVYLDTKDRNDILDQMRTDVEFLLGYNVMDYSLLLGIYKPIETDSTENLGLLHLAEQRKRQEHLQLGRNRWQRDLGGIEGRTPEGKPEVYLMCLIDILQVYDLSKRAENMYKSTVSDRKEISAIGPKTYLERFMQYMENIIVGIDGVNEQILDDRAALKSKVRSSNQSIDEATAAAVRRAAEVKAESRGMTFTFTLDDGTVVETFEDGTKIQTSPDGAVIRQNADGSIVQTNPDGMLIQRNPDGTFVQDHPDGTVIKIYPDEVAHIAPKSSTGAAMCTHQTLSSGTVIETYSDSARIQRFVDGTVIEIDASGTKTQTELDGTIVMVFKDGRKVQKNTDGSEIETRKDGSKKQTFPNGQVIELKPGARRRKSSHRRSRTSRSSEHERSSSKSRKKGKSKSRKSKTSKSPRRRRSQKKSHKSRGSTASSTASI